MTPVQMLQGHAPHLDLIRAHAHEKGSTMCLVHNEVIDKNGLDRDALLI